PPGDTTGAPATSRSTAKVYGAVPVPRVGQAPANRLCAPGGANAANDRSVTARCPAAAAAPAIVFGPDTGRAAVIERPSSGTRTGSRANGAVTPSGRSAVASAASAATRSTAPSESRAYDPCVRR